MLLEIPDEHLNDLMRGNLVKLVERLKHAHMVELRVRNNGTWQEFEADWLKHLRFQEPK